MKGEILFEKMTEISDEYVAEAALVAPVGVESPKRNRFSSLSSALNSGWGVACICFVVAIATIVGMVAWGRMGDDVPTVPPVYHPASRFSFSYEMTANDGSAWSGTAMPGDTVYVDTSVLNQGKSFDTYDFFAHAHFVLQGDDTVTLQGVYPVIDTDKHTVDSGDRGSRCFTFFIPENATPGVYDLVLSFDGEEQVFSGVLTVRGPEGETEGESETEPQPPVDTTDHPFSFGYEPRGGDAVPGTFYHMDTWVVNEGASFTFEGSSMGFAPSAVLIHMETQYRIEGNFDVTTDFRQVTVNTGDKGQVMQEFMIPADAPTGAYTLVLSYDGATQSFAGVVIVADIVEEPAVLYNLTMPIGSEWLHEPIDEAYVPGELVTVRIKFATDVGTLFFLNGEVISPSAGDDQMGYWEYSFYMPKKDSEIMFRTYDGTAPYSDILEAYYTANPKAEGVRVSDYGTYGDGVRVALIYDDRFAYTDMGSENRIGPAIIRYADSNILQVLHNGVFCSLSKAYETDLLSDADMAALENLQREWYPHLYADDE